jgi:hypothetical protein
MDERARLKDVPPGLASKSRRRPAAKLLVNHRYQLVTCGRLAVSPGVQQARDIAIGTAQALVRHTNLRLGVLTIAFFGVKASVQTIAEL